MNTESNIFLIIGCPGSGKTWLMNQLINHFDIRKDIYGYKTGLYHYLMKDGIILLGRYDNSMFEGSDRLSMSVMSDNNKMISVFDKAKLVIGEGDRFTNSTFIETFKPIILKITDDGKKGRELRGSTQTERQIKSITTRVNNIKADYEFEDSEECLRFIIENTK